MALWVKTPELKGVTVNDPNGKVTGRVSINFVDSDTAFVVTDRPSDRDNDEIVRFRDQEWSVSVRLIRRDNQWTESDPAPHSGTNSDVTRYREMGNHAPRTFRTAVMAAIINTVAENWTPMLDRKARYGRACQRLYHLNEEIRKAREALHALETEAAPFAAIVDEGV